jgi:hypothetical protein
MNRKRQHSKKLNGKPSLMQALVQRNSEASEAIDKTLVAINKNAGKEAI